MELLRRVFSHVTTRGAWPLALTFALENRDLGYVPDLMNALHQASLIRHEFDSTEHRTIELALAALPFCDADASCALGRTYDPNADLP